MDQWCLADLLNKVRISADTDLVHLINASPHIVNVHLTQIINQKLIVNYNLECILKKVSEEDI